MRCLTLLALLTGAAIASDPVDTPYLLAQPPSITDYQPLALAVDPDFTVVPILLIPRGDDAARQFESLRHCRQAILTDLQKDAVYQLTPIGAAPLSGVSPGEPISAASGFRTASGTAYLVARSGAQDPDKTEVEVRTRMQAIDGETCHIQVLSRRLALSDPERFRRDLLIRLEKFVEANRIGTPHPSRARVDGLEHPLIAWEAVDGHHILVSLVFHLRFEENPN